MLGDYLRKLLAPRGTAWGGRLTVGKHGGRISGQNQRSRCAGSVPGPELGIEKELQFRRKGRLLRIYEQLQISRRTSQ